MLHQTIFFLSLALIIVSNSLPKTQHSPGSWSGNVFTSTFFCVFFFVCFFFCCGGDSLDSLKCSIQRNDSPKHVCSLALTLIDSFFHKSSIVTNFSLLVRFQRQFQPQQCKHFSSAFLGLFFAGLFHAGLLPSLIQPACYCH